MPRASASCIPGGARQYGQAQAGKGGGHEDADQVSYAGALGLKEATVLAVLCCCWCRYCCLRSYRSLLSRTWRQNDATRQWWGVEALRLSSES